MPLEMNREVFITCAVTGSGSTQDRSPNVPRSPKEIADSAIAAAEAGAAVVHCHVREPETGLPSRKLEYYRELTSLIRSSSVDVVLNLTAGMGGDIVFGGAESPLPLNQIGTDMVGSTERVCCRMLARNLYIRLWYNEFCRSRLCNDKHPWSSSGNGSTNDSNGSQA